MPKKEITPEKVFENLSNSGEYEEAHLDKDEVAKVKSMALKDYETRKIIQDSKDPNYRVIFHISYDAFRELCDQLMRFKLQKISNHQGLFAFIVLNFKELEFDWKFLEKIRAIRNQNKYKGEDITEEMWKEVEVPMDNYITKAKNSIEENLESDEEKNP